MLKQLVMSTKKVEKIIKPGAAHFVGDGFKVHQFIPGEIGMHRLNPFIMLDYNAAVYFPPSTKQRGVGVHPHRGFETVTIAYQGKIEHQDSSGGGGIIEEGEVQWMTAAKGILHKEFHEKKFSAQGGIFQMVQLWVNLPAKYKMSPPKYQSIKDQDMGVYPIGNQGSLVKIISGSYKGVKGPASTFSPVTLCNALLKKGDQTDFEFPSEYVCAAVVIDGSVLINQKEKVAAHHFILFEQDGSTFSVSATEDCILLVLAAEPLHEPIASYGPFVMNTRQEIQEAFEDYNRGAFGYLD